MMSERTYKAVDCGPNDWDISRFVDGRFSQTLSGFMEAEAKRVVSRDNNLEKDGLNPSEYPQSLHQIYFGNPMG
jgi:hypothetical protein